MSGHRDPPKLGQCVAHFVDALRQPLLSGALRLAAGTIPRRSQLLLGGGQLG